MTDRVDWSTFSLTQLYEQLTRCEAAVRDYCRSVYEEEVSRHKLLDWLDHIQEWADRAVSICEELERRGDDPRGVRVIAPDPWRPEFPTYQDSQGREHAEY